MILVWCKWPAESMRIEGMSVTGKYFCTLNSLIFVWVCDCGLFVALVWLQAVFPYVHFVWVCECGLFVALVWLQAFFPYVIAGYLLNLCDCRLSFRSYFLHKWLGVWRFVFNNFGHHTHTQTKILMDNFGHHTHTQTKILMDNFGPHTDAQTHRHTLNLFSSGQAEIGANATHHCWWGQ